MVITPGRFIVEQVASGVTRERSSDGQMMIFAVQDGNPQTVASWAEQVKITLQNWPTNRSCYLLHDLHRSSFHAFDAFMHAKFNELFALRPELERWVAVVLPDQDCATIA